MDGKVMIRESMWIEIVRTVCDRKNNVYQSVCDQKTNRYDVDWMVDRLRNEQ